jgi:hypothetical protein
MPSTPHSISTFDHHQTLPSNQPLLEPSCHNPLSSTHKQINHHRQPEVDPNNPTAIDQTRTPSRQPQPPSLIVIITPARKPQPPSPYSPNLHATHIYTHRLPSLSPSNHHASSIASPNHHTPNTHSTPNSPNQSPKTAPPPTTNDSSGSNERGKDSRTKRPWSPSSVVGE